MSSSTGTSNTATRCTRRARRSQSHPSEHKIVGQPIKREDVAPKVFCQEDFCTDIKVPGMMHGRMIRPAVAGAVPVKVDDSAIKDIPGAKVVWDKGFLGVVADKEWDAIQAAEKLKVEWSTEAAAVPGTGFAVRSHPQRTRAQARWWKSRTATSTRRSRSAAKVIEAEYEWPFQSHASMGPACSLVEIKDGNATCWSGTQKSHFVQEGLAAMLQMPVDKVHVIFKPGPGSYGRNDADDCAMDAAVLAKAVGRPVRLQYMRDQGTGWDPKGPASTHKAQRRPQCRRRGDRLRVHQQGILAGGRRYQWRQAAGHAGRADAGRRA